MIPKQTHDAAQSMSGDAFFGVSDVVKNTIYVPLAEIDRRSRALSLAGWFTMAVALMAIGPALVDTRIVTGLNPWLKPMKFLFSFTIFSWTMAWLIGHLPLSAGALRLIGRITALTLLVETVAITLQAARGTTSHFNVTTWLDAAIYNSMGFAIIVLTGIMVLVLALFLILKVELPSVYRWGIQAGFILFLVGLIPGWIMIYNASHTVGAPDGGPGLSWINWSTRAGDLRISHFLGLHALQVLPLGGYLISRLAVLTPRRQQFCFIAFVTVYTLAMVVTFVQAMLGMPLLAW